jgi:hypothetical protein
MTFNAVKEVSGAGIGSCEESASCRVTDPAIGQATGATKLEHPILYMAIAAVGLLHWLSQPRVRHTVKHVPDALGMILLEDIEYLLVQRLDLRMRAAQALYRTRTITLGDCFVTV